MNKLTLTTSHKERLIYLVRKFLPEMGQGLAVDKDGLVIYQNLRDERSTIHWVELMMTHLFPKVIKVDLGKRQFFEVCYKYYTNKGELHPIDCLFIHTQK